MSSISARRRHPWRQDHREGTPSADHGQPELAHRQIPDRRARVATPAERRKPKKGRRIKVVGARGNNLKNVTAEIPLGTFTASPACRAAASRPS
jgi:excinuclease UvrABC ATPase subunit